MPNISKAGRGKTLYINISVYPCGNCNTTTNFTISCPDASTRFKTTLSDEGLKKLKKIPAPPRGSVISDASHERMARLTQARHGDRPKHREWARRTLFLFLYTATALSLTNANAWADYFVYHRPVYEGIVLDAETGKPLENVVIVVAYIKYTFSFPQAVLDKIAVKETTTDNNGRFHFPSYTSVINPFSRGDDPRFIIFKPGYASLYDSGNLTKVFNNKSPIYQEILWKGREDVRIKLAPGVVSLPRLLTHEDRRRNREDGLVMPSDAPILFKAFLKEDR